MVIGLLRPLASTIRPLASSALRSQQKKLVPLAQTTTAWRSSASKPRVVEYICGDQVFSGKAKVGDSLLDVVVNNDLAVDGFGACEGTLACCTCHVVLDKEHFDRVDQINPPSEEELDLLDLAPELDDCSRLGCQITIADEDPEKIVVNVPVAKRDARAL